MKTVTGLATLNEQSIVALPVLEDRVTTTRPSPLQAAPDGSATFRKESGRWQIEKELPCVNLKTEF